MDVDATKSVNQFRLVSMLEGVSYLLLLGIAMPVKYLGDEPILVRVIGPIHGVLFIAYIVALGRAMAGAPAIIPNVRAAIYFVASLLPFGAFFVEAQLRKLTRAA
jgi:integral membrane protein